MATVSIKKHKGINKTTYQVYYKDPLTGQKKYHKTYPRHRDAQHAANDLRTLLDSGSLPDNKRRKLRLMSFEQVGESLRKKWDQRLFQGTLSKRTHENYCNWLNVLIREFGDSILCQVTKEEVEGYLNRQLVENSKVSSNKYLSVFKKVFQHGLALNALISNPASAIQPLSEKEHERKRFILPHELDRLIEATKNNRGKFYMPAIICLGAEHGASRQEVLSLRWSHIDFDFAERGIIKFFRTKTKKERTEFLMPRAKKALLSWRDHLEWKRKREKITKVKSDHVLTRIDGTPLKTFNKAWWACLKEAGIKDFHFHDLRHTFCSNLILSGASLKDVKEMIGHQDISMTDRYSHLTVFHKLHQQKQLADYYMNGARPR